MITIQLTDAQVASILQQYGSPQTTPVTAPAPAAITVPGWSVRLIDLPWNGIGNVRLYSDTFGPFGNNDMLLVRFTTPATNDTATIQVVQAGGQPQVNRVLTLATEPGLISDKLMPVVTGIGAVAQPVGPILAATAGTAPVIHMQVGIPSRVGMVGLKPNTVHYLTVVNRNGFGGTASCTAASCGVDIDLQN